MKKFIKILFISLALLLSNFTNILPNSGEDMSNSGWIKQPIEVLNVARDLNIDYRELEKLKNFPIYSPLAPESIERISSPYGYRIHPIFKVKMFHTGIDYSADIGDPVRTTANGIVSFAGRKTGYGNTIEVQHMNGYSTLYAHLKDINVEIGHVVSIGDTIGTVGNTGLSTGPHLHYEVRINNKHINPHDMYSTEITKQNYMSYFSKVNCIIYYSDNV